MSLYTLFEEIKKEPLADRRTAGDEFFKAMRDEPKLVAERIDWLLIGNYGYDEHNAAWRAVNSPRANHKAQLTHMIGALEWRCEPSRAVSGWKKLSPGQKKALDSAIAAVVAGAKADRAAE